MAVRNKKKPCTNCPKPKPTVKSVVVQPLAVFNVEMDQGLRLWKHVLFGTGTCIDMIEGYMKGNLPGDPIDGVKHLRDRLTQIINTLEAKNDVPTDSAAK